MIKLLKKLFLGGYKYDPIVEGLYAHQYSEVTQDKIRKDYLSRWIPVKEPLPNPITHPYMFDPCEPPIGLVYDPFYEEWIKTVDK